MKSFKKGIALIAVLAFLITAIVPISGLAEDGPAAEPSPFEVASAEVIKDGSGPGDGADWRPDFATQTGTMGQVVPYSYKWPTHKTSLYMEWDEGNAEPDTVDWYTVTDAAANPFPGTAAFAANASAYDGTKTWRESNIIDILDDTSTIVADWWSSAGPEQLGDPTTVETHKSTLGELTDEQIKDAGWKFGGTYYVLAHFEATPEDSESKLTQTSCMFVKDVKPALEDVEENEAPGFEISNIEIPWDAADDLTSSDVTGATAAAVLNSEETTAEATATAPTLTLADDPTAGFTTSFEVPEDAEAGDVYVYDVTPTANTVEGIKSKLTITVGDPVSSPLTWDDPVTSDDGATAGTLAVEEGTAAARAAGDPIENGQNVEQGTPLKITFTPASGYQIDTAAGNGIKINDALATQDGTDSNIWTADMPAEAAEITVDIKNAPLNNAVVVGIPTGQGTLTLTAGENSLASSTTDQSKTGFASESEQVTVTYTPPADGSYNLTSVTVTDASDTTSTVTLTNGTGTFNMPGSAIKVTATPTAVAQSVLTYQLSPNQGTLKVANNGSEIPSGTVVKEGTPLTITWEPVDGWMVSADGGVTYGPTGTGSSATPDPNSTNTWTLNMPSAATLIKVTPTAAQKYALTFTALDAVTNATTNKQGSFVVTAGGVPVKSGDLVQQSAAVEVTFTPNATETGSFALSGITTAPAASPAAAALPSNSNAYSFSMPAAATTINLTGITPVNTAYSLEAVQPSADQGKLTVSPAGFQLPGTMITVTYEPPADGSYEATGVSFGVSGTENAAKSAETNTWTFAMPSAATKVKATVAEVQQATITIVDPTNRGQAAGTLAVTDPDGSVIKSGDTVKAGTLLTVTYDPAGTANMATAVTYATDANTLPADQSPANPNVFTFTMPTADATVEAVVQAARGNYINVTNPGTPAGSQGTLTITANGQTVGENDTVAPNTVVTVTYNQPESGDKTYRLVSVTATAAGGATVIPPQADEKDPNVWTFYMPNGETTVSASVAEVKPYRLTLVDPAATPAGSQGTITATAGESSITSAAPGQVNDGTVVTVTYTPSNGYMITAVTATGGVTPKQDSQDPNVWTFVMPSTAVTVTASASPAPLVALTIQQPEAEAGTLAAEADGNTYTTSGQIAQNTQVTIKYTPVAPYTGGELNTIYTGTNTPVTPAPAQGAENEWTLVMPDSPVTVSVTPKQEAPAQEYSIATTATPETGGTVTTDPAETAAEGTEVTVSVTANEGYELEDLKVADAEENEVDTTAVDPEVGGQYTFTMPVSNVTISATFKEVGTPTEVTFDVTPPDAASGEAPDQVITAAAVITPAPAQGTWTGLPDGITAAEDGSVEIPADAEPGYHDLTYTAPDGKTGTITVYVPDKPVEPSGTNVADAIDPENPESIETPSISAGGTAADNSSIIVIWVDVKSGRVVAKVTVEPGGTSKLDASIVLQLTFNSVNPNPAARAGEEVTQYAEVVGYAFPAAAGESGGPVADVSVGSRMPQSAINAAVNKDGQTDGEYIARAVYTKQVQLGDLTLTLPENMNFVSVFDPAGQNPTAGVDVQLPTVEGALGENEAAPKWVLSMGGTEIASGEYKVESGAVVNDDLLVSLGDDAWNAASNVLEQSNMKDGEYTSSEFTADLVITAQGQSVIISATIGGNTVTVTDGDGNTATYPCDGQWFFMSGASA